MRNLEHYLTLPYTVILKKDEEGDVIARVEELPGCIADGPTATEALLRIEEAKTLWIEDALEAGDPVPEPQFDDALPSGKWLQRVPRTLHRKLSELAARESVSLNQFVTSVLAEAAGWRLAAGSSKGLLAVQSLGSVGNVAVLVDAKIHYWDQASFGSKWSLFDLTAPEADVDVAFLAAVSSKIPNDFSRKLEVTSGKKAERDRKHLW